MTQNNELQRIVLPEGEDERVLLATKILIKDHVCHPVLIGDITAITDVLGVSTEYTAIAPDDTELKRLAEEAREKGKEFSVSPALVQGAALVREGRADSIVAGAANSTTDVIMSYIKSIGMQEGVSRATSCFLMEKGQERYLFADCGMNIDPSAEVLAETAYMCAEFADLVDIDPKVAFLSFSTKGSAKHESVDKMTEALGLTKERWPDMLVDGELQFDAAFVPEIAATKAPDSPLKGRATVFIFPDLNAGNIAYKLVERLGGFKATGPLLLGFAKPAHDLSRGCSAEDIVRAVKIACLQGKKEAK